MWLNTIVYGPGPGQDRLTEGSYTRVLVLLDRFMSICADPGVPSSSMIAIRQALPGRSPDWARSILLFLCVLEPFTQPNATTYGCHLVHSIEAVQPCPNAHPCLGKHENRPIKKCMWLFMNAIHALAA